MNPPEQIVLCFRRLAPETREAFRLR